MAAPSPEISIAIGSAIIALSALIVTVGQFHIQRQHNKLSVKPHIDGSRNRHIKDQNFIYSYSIENNGIGPAIIKARRFYLDGAEFCPTAISFAEAICDRVFKGKYQYHLICHSMPDDGCVIKPSQSVKIIEVNFVTNQNFSIAEVQKDFDRADLEIDYESFYGEKKTFSSKD